MGNPASATHPWLKSARFDLTFIVGVAALGLLSGAAVVVNPDLFWPIFTADVWLLGYHHLVSTFTRLTFDKESFRQHRMLVLGLPWLVAGSVTALTLTFGIWLLPTIYLYWQWFHYTRQSEGISKAFAGKARGRYTGDQRLTRIIFWLMPLAGLATVSARSPAYFLNMPVRTLPFPALLANFLVALAVAAFLVWLVQHIRAAVRGELALPYFMYMLSHFVIYFVAYIALRQIDFGWLTINIWHNAQYILFVWLYNNRRFGGEVSNEHKFLSTISQGSRFLLYMAVCLTISTAAYFLLGHYFVDFAIGLTGYEPIVIALIIYQTLNFHHYVVDSRIWKLRKKPIRANLGISD